MRTLKVVESCGTIRIAPNDAESISTKVQLLARDCDYEANRALFPRYLYGYGMRPHYPFVYAILTIIIFNFIFRWAGIKIPFIFSIDAFHSGTIQLPFDVPKLTEKSSDWIKLALHIEIIPGLIFYCSFLLSSTQ